MRNKVLVILTTIVVISLCSCIPGLKPNPPSLQPPSVVSVLDCPERAHVGDYITVRVKVSQPGGVYLLCIVLSETSDPNDTVYQKMGRSQQPDDNLIVSWYAPVPELPAGSYMVEVIAQNQNIDRSNLTVLRRCFIITK